MLRFAFILFLPFYLTALSNREIVEQLYSSIVKQEYKTIDSLMANHYQIIDLGGLTDNSDTSYTERVTDINKRTRLLHRALPGFTIKVEQIVTEGNKVMVRTKLSGLQKGAFMGVAATNKPVVLRNFVEFTIENEKITRAVELWNELAVMRQMGYIVLN